VYARHVEDPAAGGRELMGCPTSASGYGGQGSPLYVNPVNIPNILTKILAEEQVLRSRLMAGGGTVRDRPEEASGKAMDVILGTSLNNQISTFRNKVI